MPEVITFDQFLRAKRESRGLSQGDLAENSGISRSYLNKLETGKVDPTKARFETLWALAQNLELGNRASIEFLLLAGERWQDIADAIADGIIERRGGTALSLESAIEADPVLDSEAKQALRVDLRAHRARIREEQREANDRRLRQV